MTKPKTRDEILALPRMEQFTERRELRDDGTYVVIPVMRRATVLMFEPDDPFVVFDDEGRGWQLAMVEGQYVRQRCTFYD